MTIAIVAAVVAVVALLALTLSVRVIKQYGRVVLFELGKVKDSARGPGIMFIVPLVDRVHWVSLRIITMPIQSQGGSEEDSPRKSRFGLRVSLAWKPAISMPA
jgi:regulator of protease activity HflC (stomatin/prohibitin superfamily)